MAERTEVYSLSEMGKADLPPALARIKKVLEPANWDHLIEHWNFTIQSAETCEVTKGLLTNYIGVHEDLFGPTMMSCMRKSNPGCPLGSIADYLEAVDAVYQALDKEIVLALGKNCQCKVK